MWRFAGVVVQGMRVEFGVGVCAPHVVGFGGLGELGRDSVGMGGVYTDELAFFGEEVWGIWEGSCAIESLSGTWHGGWSYSHTLLGPIGELEYGR